MKIGLSMVTVVLLGVLLCGCNSLPSGNSAAKVATGSTQPPVAGTPAPSTPAFDDSGRAELRGVSFTYDPKVFSVRGEEVLKDSPLEAEDDKPGEDFPKHIVFYLKYADQEAAIRIFPIDEYRRMYAVSPHLTKGFDEQLNGIRKASADQSFRLKGQMPFIPFYDAGQEFQNKVTKAQFQNGKGFFFLTEWTIEPTIIDNERLRYVYQGITSDGGKYVLADFSVDAPFLPKNAEAGRFEDYVVPEHFYADKANANKYEAYVAKIARRLEKLADAEFHPDLRSIRDLVSSLTVN